MLIASLREVIRKQAEEIESLQKQLKERPAQQDEVGIPVRMHFRLRD